MSIVEFVGPLSWPLDASESGRITKYPWVGVVHFVLFPVSLNGCLSCIKKVKKCLCNSKIKQSLFHVTIALFLEHISQ